MTIPGYLLAAAGFFGIVHARQRGRDSEIDALLDASVAALAALALGMLFVVNPTQIHSTFQIRVVLAVYPALSVFLVASTAGLAFSTGTRRIRANGWLLGAMAGVLLGDLVYMLLETHAIDLPLRRGGPALRGRLPLHHRDGPRSVDARSHRAAAGRVRRRPRSGAS